MSDPEPEFDIDVDLEVEPETAEGGARRLFEAELRPLPPERRAELGRSADGDLLLALCLDPDPSVVAAILENDRAGPTHARLIAFHHRNPVGLEALTRRRAFAIDAEVQRRLLRNPQTSDVVLRRLLTGRRVDELYALTTSRELAERSRRLVRESFRQAFQRADDEEKVRLILRTEGRCLGGLAGIALGSKGAALLCGAAIGSTLLAQNLANWPTSPPAVVAHLLKQPIVQRTPHLKQAALRHPNCPANLKRGI